MWASTTLCIVADQISIIYIILQKGNCNTKWAYVQRQFYNRAHSWNSLITDNIRYHHIYIHNKSGSTYDNIINCWWMVIK